MCYILSLIIQETLQIVFTDKFKLRNMYKDRILFVISAYKPSSNAFKLTCYFI